jgi:sRNA-binding carbon storage regulator CsrA
MLVLSRSIEKPNIKIIASAPCEITVTLVKMEHGKVRLGFTSPQGETVVRIFREELLDARNSD